ncbi:probable serine/threonine-protein kinase atr1 [Drosophila elegans]|uniref:probable serine/threonine-protein kinase atr1 n=1 Tax=Drosophila elegans TaxID=30023 RepID=UPI0007E858BD|nr:probable serine/threonine-protein kinase atr1 [Drosophila elegans]
MKYLFVVALFALAIQLAYSASGTTTTTTAATTTTTTTTAATTATTTASSTHKKRCWKGNNWCHTRIPKKKCKHPKRCHKTVVIVTRRKN